jgi:type I restriction enzyme, S subunit
MEGEWKNTSIADISLSINTGLDAIRRAPIVNHPTNLRCLRIQDISQNKSFERWGYTETTPTDLNKYKLTKDEIIMARTCSTGICYLVKEDLPAVFNNGLARIRLDTKKAYPKFIYHVFKSQRFTAFIDSISGGTSVQLNMKVGDMAKYELPLPPLPEQKAIAHILGSLDDKIELNRRMNATLEGMAQALFKSWFVDFDPVIDNALAAGNPIPDELADRAEVRRQALANGTANRDVAKYFPANFQQTESMGWIPEGWETGKLSDLLEIKYGKDHKKLNEGSIPVYGSGGLMRYADKSLYSGESVLIPRKGTLSNILYLNEEFWTVDTMFYTIPNIKNAPKYSFYHLKSLDFASMNVGSAVPSMTTKVLNELPILLPEENVLRQFDTILTSYFLKTEANNKQTETLTKLRDNLLPKLISGDLRIPEAKQITKETLT